MIKKYDVLAEGWMTDAHGTAKWRQVGDSIDLADDQAYWLKKARTIGPPGSVKAAATEVPPAAQGPAPSPIKRK